MQGFKVVLFSALVALVACGSEASLQQGPQGFVEAPPDPPGEKSQDGSTAGDGGQTAQDDSGTGGQDGSSVNPNPGGPDSGGPGGPDSGGPGGPDGGGGGGPVVTSNSHNWSGWADTTACPAWGTTPYAWKEPRTTGIGTQVCGIGDVFATGGLYDAYLGPSANATAQAQWNALHASCKTCAISDWTDPVWGPVVRTPNGHYVLNQAGCVTLKDPARKSCALSNWQYRQCGKEACDSAVGQPAYQQCVDAASSTINGLCGEAANGASKADYTVYSNASPAWDLCYAINTGDNLKAAAARVVVAQCY